MDNLSHALRLYGKDKQGEEKMRIKVKLVFDDWQKKGKSVYNTEKGMQLSEGLFHSGTTFEGSMELPSLLDAQELEKAIKEGYQPVFWVTI